MQMILGSVPGHLQLKGSQLADDVKALSWRARVDDTKAVQRAASSPSPGHIQGGVAFYSFALLVDIVSSSGFSRATVFHITFHLGPSACQACTSLLYMQLVPGSIPSIFT